MRSFRALRRSGFTLIEVMIVVAIVGILASVALPNYTRFHLRSKAGEAKVNLGAIRTAEGAYFAEFGLYVSASPHPATWAPGVAATQKLPWDDAAAVGFSTIGWLPEGDVYFRYHVQVPAGNGLEYIAEAQSDLDGNGALNTWGYVHPPMGASAATTDGAWGCDRTGVSGTGTGIDIVGPCCPDCGRTIF